MRTRSSSESGESKSGPVRAARDVVGVSAKRWRFEGGGCGGVSEDDEAVQESSSARSRLGGMVRVDLDNEEFPHSFQERRKFPARWVVRDATGWSRSRWLA